MRISDWSSDVCSSDLRLPARPGWHPLQHGAARRGLDGDGRSDVRQRGGGRAPACRARLAQRAADRWRCLGYRPSGGVPRERRGPLDYRPNAFGRRRRAADPPQPAMAQPSQLREGAALLNGIEALRARPRTVLDAATWQYLEAGTEDRTSIVREKRGYR